MKKRDITVLSILSVIVGVFYVSGLPMGLIPCSFADIDGGCLPNFFNVVLCLILIFATVRLCRIDIRFGLTGDRLAEGVKNTLPVAAIYILGFVIANAVNSLPLGNMPSAVRILVESVGTVFFAAFLEELLLRGLLINLFERAFRNSKHMTLLSVLAAASFFAIGHVPSVLDQGLLMCLFRFAYPFCMGVLFGAFYRKYGNLWLPVICHFVLNSISLTVMLFAAAPVETMKPIAMAIIVPVSLFGGICGIRLAMQTDREKQAG